MKTTVSEKGQITIPKALRDRLGIRPGHVLEIEEESGRLVAHRLVPEDPVEAVYGILADAGSEGTDAWIEALRGAPEDDER